MGALLTSTSIGGSRYAMVFSDDATSRHTPYYLADRRFETTVKVLDEFSIMAECQMGKKLKKIRCDNEFDCELWRKWAAERGVIIELIPPYSSVANGMAEWALGIIFGAVRMMLVEAKMSHGWWAEACDYVIKARNLLPSSQHPGKVPEEARTGLPQRNYQV